MNEIQVRSQTTDVVSLEKVASVFSASGYFDRTNLAQATTKLILGRSIGLTEYESMTQLNIFQGKIHVGTLVMASRLKASGKYTYRSQTDDKQSTVRFFEKIDNEWNDIGSKTYTIEMAQRAGLASRDVWKKFPEAMLNARAMSAGIREHCPDVFGGSHVYSYEHGEAECEDSCTEKETQPSPSVVTSCELDDYIENLPELDPVKGLISDHAVAAKELRQRVIDHDLGEYATRFIETVSEARRCKIERLEQLDPKDLNGLATMIDTKIDNQRLAAQGA